MALAKERHLGFGVKLTNTLGTVNNKGALPGDEMYMSGRALFPLSINVAALLSGLLTASCRSPTPAAPASSIFAKFLTTGIHPITMATDLLKPGGYLRLSDVHARAGAV
jgi:putative selenate reductase